MARQNASRTRPSWTRISDATREDLLAHEAADQDFAASLPDRVLAHLEGLRVRGVANALPVDRLTHCLQTATRAHRDGRDEEYVVCCLLHDIGDLLAPYRHAELAALLLDPFVSDANLFMVRHHGIFQGYHFFDKMGHDRNARDRFRDSPHFEHAVAFSEYDNESFDPDYDTLPLEFFAPMVTRVLARTPRWATGDESGMTGTEIQGMGLDR